ncbi:MAG: hypothetical protein ACE361_09025 [Aureliella sp.]
MNQTFARVLAFLSLAFAAALCPGQDAGTRLTAPKLFPEKTLAYIRVDDVKKLKADLGKSSIGKLGNDDKIKPIVSEFYGSIVRSAEELESSIGLNLDELLSIPSGEMAVALLPSERNSSRVERNGDGDERSVRVNVQPAVAVLLDAGEEISSVQLLLSRMEEAAGEQMVHEEKAVGALTLHRYANPERERQQFGYFIDDGVILACSDINYLEKLAEKWQGQLEDAKTLADNRKFTSIMSRCVGTEGERPQVSFYLDPLAMVRQFAPKTTATSMTLAVLPALGVDGIEAVGGSWIIAPPAFDSISHLHLQLSSPRRGVLSLLKPKSGSTEPESWVPDSVASYSTINWDLNSTLQGVERLYNQFRGEDALEKEVFARLGEQLDLNFREDVLDQLEGRISLMQGFVRPVTINSGSNVYALKINNIKYFKSTVMPKIIEKIEERTEVKLASFGKLRVNVLKFGRELPPDSPIRQPQICFTTIDDYLVIADSEYMLREVASCLNDSIGPLSESLEYQLIADSIEGQLQGQECSAISFARPEESLQLFYELARDPANKDRLRQISENNGFFKALLTTLEKHELPPFSVISQYLAPGGGFLVDEETGLHYMSFSLRRE